MAVLLDLLQWPAMLLTVLAAWCIGSRQPRRRRAGFCCFISSNVLWVIWGWQVQAWALIVLQFCLCAMNLRGWKKNTTGSPVHEHRPDFDLTNLDRLLRTFTERPQALNLDTQLPVLMQALQADHLDLLPLPGQGHTLQRWQTLARIAGCDLALPSSTKGTPMPWRSSPNVVRRTVGDGVWGVWAAEPPDARARILARHDDQVRLGGCKAWCSGALQIDRALITAWGDDGQPQLVAIELAHPNQRIQVEQWQAVGMATTTSVEIRFDDAPGIAVGRPGQYLQRPGFWHGGAGIAACWYGAAEALADYLREHCRKPTPDAHAQAHLGAVDAALYGARAALRECAGWIDRQPTADASFGCAAPAPRSSTRSSRSSTM